jgi:serine/threonine protein kinase
MPEGWKQWEGRVANEEFPLLRYLGGSERSAVFLSKRADGEPQEVAIKLILANAENPELQLSWWELAAKLSHPHLLRLFRMGRSQLDGTDFIFVVTEYAEESLAQIIPYRALTPAEAQDMLRSVTDALTYIHGKGFVHGHINPSNIMAVGDQIKISSDGLCGTGESMRVLRQPSVYTAPEIAAGGNMSAASDTWSLGVTLVEALTQHPPAVTNAGQIDVVLPETLPEPFSDIASHCLRRDPQRRWLIADITRRLQQPSSAPEPAVTAIPQPGFTKWGYAIAAVAVVLLLALVGQRLMHHGSAPSSPTQSPATPSGAAPSTQSNQSKQPASAALNSSHPEAGTDTTENAAAHNSSSSGPQGAVSQQIMPAVSRNALHTVHGKLKVRVKVSVDSSGKVLIANFDSRGPSQYFAERSLQAARQWTFQPPQVGGKSVPSEWILKFQFEKTGVSASPKQTFP